MDIDLLDTDDFNLLVLDELDELDDVEPNPPRRMIRERTISAIIHKL